MIGNRTFGNHRGISQDRRRPEGRQEFCRKGACCNAIFRKRCLSGRLPGGGRLGGQTREPNDVNLLFIAGEVKCLVLDERTTYGESVVLVTQWRCFLSSRRDPERRVRSVKLISIEVVSRAVDLVAARLDDQVYRTAGVAPGFRARLRLG